MNERNLREPVPPTFPERKGIFDTLRTSKMARALALTAIPAAIFGLNYLTNKSDDAARAQFSADHPIVECSGEVVINDAAIAEANIDSFTEAATDYVTGFSTLPEEDQTVVADWIGNNQAEIMPEGTYRIPTANGVTLTNPSLSVDGARLPEKCEATVPLT